MNELTTLRQLRSDVPTPADDALRAAEARLVATIRLERRARPRPARRLAWSAAFATGLAAVAAVGVLAAHTRPMEKGDEPADLTTAAQILGLAATAADGRADLAPGPGQAIMIKSTTTHLGTYVGGARFLYRTERTNWQPVDTGRYGALEIRHLEPEAFAGEPIPPEEIARTGRVELHSTKPCPGGSAEFSRRQYNQLRFLPTTPEKMLAFLRASSGATNDPKADRRSSPDELTFGAAGEMVGESYLPAPQRAALYRALALIPGLELVENATDAAGRAGVGVAFRDTNRGVRRELIFDPETFRYLGERAFVTDAAAAKAPVGAQTAATAQLSAEVVDTIPPAPHSCG